MRSWRGQRGYTTVELIIAATMFALISITVLGALVTIIQSSTKTSAERKVQQDARYSIEEIARQTRSALIDYQFYTKAEAEPGTEACRFSPEGSNSTKMLALVFSESNESGAPATRRLVFFDRNHAIYRYEEPVAGPTPSCDAVLGAPIDDPNRPSQTKITADDVAIPDNGLTFYISPNQDPYDQDPCVADPNVSDTNCEIARNTHPRVTILMKVSTIGSGSGVSSQSKIGSTILETTIGSRAYPTKTLLGPTPTPASSAAPNPPVTQTINGSDFQNCQAPSRADFCQTNDPAHPNAVYSLSAGSGNPDFSAQYNFSGLPSGTYNLTLSYYNFSLGGLNPPANYTYRIRINYPGGSQTVNLPIESNGGSQNLHEFTISGLPLSPNPPITVTWDNDSYQPAGFDANFGLNSLKMVGQ